jgi:hypothetical protein
MDATPTSADEPTDEQARGVLRACMPRNRPQRRRAFQAALAWVNSEER